MPTTHLERWQPPAFAALIDRPAREGLTRAHTGIFATLAPALFGLTLAFLTTTAGLAFAGATPLVEPVARAMVEALLLAVPVLIVITTLTTPSLSPSSTASILSVSLGVAGLSTALILPLLAFLRLCTEQALTGVPHSLQLLIAPAMFLIAVPVVLERALTAINPSGRWLAWLFAALSSTVFLMRVSPFLAWS
jgi:hypothetical protein